MLNYSEPSLVLNVFTIWIFKWINFVCALDVFITLLIFCHLEFFYLSHSFIHCYACVFCLHMFLYRVHAMLSRPEGTCKILWNRSYMWLWVTTMDSGNWNEVLWKSCQYSYTEPSLYLQTLSFDTVLPKTWLRQLVKRLREYSQRNLILSHDLAVCSSKYTKVWPTVSI